jgi:hypothetical protein
MTILEKAGGINEKGKSYNNKPNNSMRCFVIYVFLKKKRIAKASLAYKDKDQEPRRGRVRLARKNEYVTPQSPLEKSGAGTTEVSNVAVASLVSVRCAFRLA